MLKPYVLHTILKDAAKKSTLVSLSTIVQSVFVMECNLPPYIEIKINDETKLTQFRQELSAELCALYHIDIAANRLPLSALFVGEKSQQPGPLLRKLMESTYGLEFASNAEWCAHWRDIVNSIYEHYQKDFMTIL
ncbi:hypothetical protein KAM329D_40240 [Aeromonas caviae]|jgi:hypothetical protein|uniref:Uncharacterized protein n=1 Tax=Aeromonas taiwanensis TaxID=633417 RepID=A0A5F0K426_9GAMM|nr:MULTISPECIES: hypothetical protein [Aeromonas]AUV15290.1 hypothetical protein C2U47_00465 [Aeromonas sp. ASNIH7]MDM5109000.1 hypothetical protein [Aeromonas caviae]MDX7920283.1 hypothetical protein [Aeromonas caviae]TFF70859.1 hypothetical protein DRM93_20820 [Aeromonas taiwanensis]TFF71597.1 hypothetical protein DRM95_21100 [Aeromonas taiwanensis]